MLLMVLPLLMWSECHDSLNPQIWEAGGPEMINEQIACMALQA